LPHRRVYCDGQVCGSATTEQSANASAPNPATAYVESLVELGITPNIKAASIILAVIGPVFMLGFYVAVGARRVWCGAV
jgi:hypothetical protein